MWLRHVVFVVWLGKKFGTKTVAEMLGEGHIWIEANNKVRVTICKLL